MPEWIWVVIPAFVLALFIRADSKFVGPYFAASSIIAGTEGFEAGWWYNRRSLRLAFLRRLVYAIVMGFLLAALSPLAPWEISFVGFLGALLLVWPVVFHGYPRLVSRRDWEVPVLYVGMSLLFASLALAGAWLWALIDDRSGGDGWGWIFDQVVGSVVLWMVVLVLGAAFVAVQGHLSRKVHRRAKIEDEEGGRFAWDARDAINLDPPSGANG